MSIKAKRLPSALKHGAYSEAALLPGDDPDEFKALHEGLIADFSPNGRMEEETVLSIARLTWRRQNLARFELGQLSHYIFETLKRVLAEESDSIRKFDKEIMAAFDKVAEVSKRAREAKGTRPAVEVVEGWNVAVLARLMKELDVEQRLDAMIDRLLKRLLFVRGLKSITSSEVMPSPSSARTSLPRI
jgi:hypothetical protein